MLLAAPVNGSAPRSANRSKPTGLFMAGLAVEAGIGTDTGTVDAEAAWFTTGAGCPIGGGGTAAGFV